MSRISSIFEFLELNKKKSHRIWFPRALRVTRPGHFARFFMRISRARPHLPTGDRFPLLKIGKSEIHQLGQAGPRRQPKRCRKVQKLIFAVWGDSVASAVLPVWRGWFPSVSRALGDPFASFFCASARWLCCIFCKIRGKCSESVFLLLP